MDPANMGYANHDLYFLVFAAAMSGNFGLSRDAADELSESTHSEAFAIAPLLARSRFARWNDIIRRAPPDDEQLGTRWFWHYARGCAFAQTGNPQRAKQELTEMENVYAEIRPGRAFGMFFNDWSVLDRLASNVLHARISSAQGDDSMAIQYLLKAVDVQDQMNFDDLPDWYYPVRESLGAALLRAGLPRQAEEIFRQDLVRNPQNPRSLFGLWKVLEAEKKWQESALIRQSFERVWKGDKDELQLSQF